MAAASSEGSPTTPNTPTIFNSTHPERSSSRSPSLSSIIDEFQWTPLLVSKAKKRKSRYYARDSVCNSLHMKAQGMVEGGDTAMEQDMAGAQDTIYLCNFRVSVDGEWLCLKELHDVEFNMQDSLQPLSSPSPEIPTYPFGRDPVVIERSNLVNISKLVVKELIEQSLRYGRMLDSDHMPLQHFFIVLEHVLRHGLRPKKGLLGPKKELWDILQMVEKYTPEAQDITASVRDLPTVRTHMGRARAWLRLALMQKKLADYLKVLLDHKDEALAEYFEPDALMLSDEAIIIIGLLVGLNVIDCNLCVKEEDLDCPQGVIDFSLYLRSSHQLTGEPLDEQQGDDNMTTVLDQKNYIEELNRHLNATVTNLQTKVESLTTTNALMKEDLAIAKNSLLALYDENRQLRKELGREDKPDAFNVCNDARLAKISNEENGESSRALTGDASELQQRLEEERRLRQEADKELEIQLCIKAEMEVAMKLLEKDIHEKQDTIISLRRQLDDIKLINLEMYKKLQECEMELTQKGEVVSRLQAKAGQIGKILNNLEKYNHLIKDSNRDKKSFEKRPTSFDKKFVPTSKIELKDLKNSDKAKTGTNSTEVAHSGQSSEKLTEPEIAAATKQPIETKEECVIVAAPAANVEINSNQAKIQVESIEQPQECEGSLKHKTELVAKLEAKAQSMSDTIQALEAKYRESEIERTNVEQKRRELDIQAAHHEEQATNVEGDLKVEREWRISLQENMQQDRERISQLQLELTHLKAIAQKYATLQEEYYTLKERWLEQEQTLEELGAHLSVSKLQISDLREEAGRKTDGAWAEDKSATHCKGCSKEFNMTRRKHHCRNCGEIFCNACSDNTMALPSSAKPVRVCDDCHVLLVGRYSVI